MNPTIAVAIASLIAPAFVLPAQSSQLTESEYATIMASMSACDLDVDMSKMGQAMIDAGIDPKNQEDAENIGQMTVDEGKRVFTMTSAEQAKHCAKVRQRMAALGLK